MKSWQDFYTFPFHYIHWKHSAAHSARLLYPNFGKRQEEFITMCQFQNPSKFCVAHIVLIVSGLVCQTVLLVYCSMKKFPVRGICRPGSSTLKICLDGTLKYIQFYSLKMCWSHVLSQPGCLTHPKDQVGMGLPVRIHAFI